MNKQIYYTIFISGIIIAGIFHIIATFYYKYAEQFNITFIKILLLSIFFGILSYCIKIPIFYYFSNNMNVMFINIIFTTITFILVILYSRFILKEKIPIYTLIITILIILLIILNHLLDVKSK